jgi:F0F1-type ATP synthase membrane subunit a
MTSWTVLLAMTVVWISSMTNGMFWFNFPIWLPVLIYLQEILVAFIQALVFPLLVAIFIKVAMTQMEEA